MKIDFFIAGFQKAATTKVKDMISYNSKVSMHTLEEMTGFIDEEFNDKLNDNIFSEYYHELTEGSLVGAKSVSMVISENAIKRLKQHNPACKLIIVLRNPIKRAYSAYWYCRRMGWETSPTFTEAIAKSPQEYSDGIVRRSCDYLGQSDYAKHISVLYKYFPKEQVKIYILEDDLQDIERLNADMCDFLNIKPDFLTNEVKSKNVNSSALPKYLWLTKVIRGKSGVSTFIKNLLPNFIVRRVKSLKQNIIKLNESEFTPPPIVDELKHKLEAEFANKNQQLSMLIGKDLSSWKS